MGASAGVEAFAKTLTNSREKAEEEEDALTFPPLSFILQQFKSLKSAPCLSPFLVAVAVLGVVTTVCAFHPEEHIVYSKKRSKFTLTWSVHPAWLSRRNCAASAAHASSSALNNPFKRAMSSATPSLAWFGTQLALPGEGPKNREGLFRLLLVADSPSFPSRDSRRDSRRNKLAAAELTRFRPPDSFELRRAAADSSLPLSACFREEAAAGEYSHPPKLSLVSSVSFPF
jgi:hypothetical protein